MKRIIQNIFNDILEISDLNMQKKLWLNENNDTGLISSYIELMSRLFDDNNFNNFVDNEVIKIGLDLNLISQLIELRDALDNYQEKETDEEIINDSKWIGISEHAKLIIKMWFSPYMAQGL